MSREIKKLNPCAVATIMTGVVLVHDFEGVGEAFNHIMGHPVWTHEMPVFGDRAKELVLAQYPDFPVDRPADWQALADSLLKRWPDGIPIAEGEEVRPADPIATVRLAMDKRGQQ